jgi:Raf kinase inhibitor-like YbhB/YbcL family protein
MQLQSPSFTHGTTIPTKHTCDGVNMSPELTWTDLPSNARSLALRVLDPDAPSGTFTHWLIWDLNLQAGGVPEGRVPDDAREGTNGFGDVGYGGPCPPPRRGVHHYHFELIALREPIILDEGAGREAFDAAVRERRLEVAELVGLYERR